MALFSDDFRCITMDQRNASGGESSGPVDVDDPWGALADDQLGVMDHLGIDKFMFIGYCIGGPFALKLIERAPDRVAAAVLCQPVGHASKTPRRHVRVWRRLGRGAARAAARRDPGDHRPVRAQSLPSAAGLHVQRVAGLRACLPDAATGAARRHAGALLRGGDGLGGDCAQRAGQRSTPGRSPRTLTTGLSRRCGSSCWRMGRTNGPIPGHGNGQRLRPGALRTRRRACLAAAIVAPAYRNPVVPQPAGVGFSRGYGHESLALRRA